MDKTQISKVFGQNLRALRESRQQTRNAFAASIGGFASTVQGYETGTKLPTFRRFCALCDALQVSPNQLLAGLFPWQTELADLKTLETVMEGLQGHLRQRIVNIQEEFIHCALETPPKLTGASLGSRISILRMDAGLDAAELAEQCAISKPTLQGYESGQYDPSLPVLLLLCEAFGVSPEYILAPVLKNVAIGDPRLIALKPRQISALRSMTQKLADMF